TVQKGKANGPCVQFLKHDLGNNARLAASGDSQDDIPMRAVCDYAYATARCSQVAQQFGKKSHCRVVKQPRQAGLLEAVRHRLQSDGVALGESSRISSRLNSDHLIQTLLEVADRRPLQQLLAVLVYWTL